MHHSTSITYLRTGYTGEHLDVRERMQQEDREHCNESFMTVPFTIQWPQTAIKTLVESRQPAYTNDLCHAHEVFLACGAFCEICTKFATTQIVSSLDHSKPTSYLHVSAHCPSHHQVTTQLKRKNVYNCENIRFLLLYNSN